VAEVERVAVLRDGVRAGDGGEVVRGELGEGVAAQAQGAAHEGLLRGVGVAAT
jgi:hypothetical protein